MERLNQFRKYSFEETFADSIQQLNQQLKRLNERTDEHFHKRKKELLQFERRNNHYRTRQSQFDEKYRKIIDENQQLIRQIKIKIIRDDRHERQQRTDQHQRIYQRPLTSFFLLVGILFLATMIILFLNQTNKNYF